MKPARATRHGFTELDGTVAQLARMRHGFHSWPRAGWLKFRRGRPVDGTPALFNAYTLRAAHFEQIGF